MKQRKPTRLKDYDYSLTGWYFVTICTKDHKNYFGKIEDGNVLLNKLGDIANKCWQGIPEHFPN